MSFLQPVIVIGVCCLISPPFWPTMLVGITSFWPQKLYRSLAGRFGPSAGYWRCGNVSSKLVNGSPAPSRTCGRDPGFADERFPVDWTVTPSPVSTTISSGYLAHR